MSEPVSIFAGMSAAELRHWRGLFNEWPAGMPQMLRDRFEREDRVAGQARRAAVEAEAASLDVVRELTGADAEEITREAM